MRFVWWLEEYREHLAGSHADPGRAEALAKAWNHMTPQDKDGWRDMIFERLKRRRHAENKPAGPSLGKDRTSATQPGSLSRKDPL